MMLTSFILIFMAEMADKTQLLVLALSRRYSLRSVISGMTLSIVLLSLLSVWAGSWLNACIPIDAIRPAAAVLFLLFGFSALKPKPEEVKEGRRFHADWLSVAAAFFIAVFFLFGSWTLFQLFSPTQLQIVIYCLILFLSAYLYVLWQERRS